MKIKYIDRLGILKENNCTFTDVKTASLTPNEFLIISTKPESLSLDESIKTFKASSCFALSGDYQETTIALSNDYGQHWFAETTYSPSQGENDLGKSLEKKILTDENSWEPSCKDGGTPGEEPKICGTETVSADEDTTNSPEKCTASSEDIKLNEIFPYPESGNEFVEITNTGESCVDISGWKIMDEAGHKKEFTENSTMGPGEYFFLEGNLYLNNDSDTAYLLSRDGDTKNDALDSRHFEKAQKDFSYSFNGKEWQWTSAPTPNEENIITDTNSKEDAGDSNSGKEFFPNEKIYLNEILPNPKGEEEKEEFIEILNGESGPVDLFGWTIRDGSKTGKYVFKEHTEIGPKEYLAIYRPQFKIALNNSEDSVSLYNPKGEFASSVSFDKSIENASYSFDGKGWRWSKYLTPGKENKFDSVPSVKITKPKHTYKDLYTDFSAKAKDKETKKLSYTWDFGDGKKSYLAKTSHKYLDTGKYTVTLTVGDDSQTVEKSFVLAVKNYPRLDLEIAKIVPNPVGNDSDGEIVEIRNNSGKKIELQGWKIASGSDDKIYNHPISSEISLEPNETKTITREICKFSLNNKAGKIQLVMPDGKVTDVVEYQKEKIADDEAYVKINDEWRWVAPNTPAETGGSEETIDSEDTQDEKSEEQPDGEILGASDENIPYFAPTQSGYTSEDAFIFLKLFGLLDYKPQEIKYCPVNNSPSPSLLIASL